MLDGFVIGFVGLLVLYRLGLLACKCPPSKLLFFGSSLRTVASLMFDYCAADASCVCVVLHAPGYGVFWQWRSAEVTP